MCSNRSVGESSGASGSGAGARARMVIKPFKNKPKPPAAFEQTTMATLAEAVEAVYSKRAITQSQEELYRVNQHLFPAMCCRLSLIASGA